MACSVDWMALSRATVPAIASRSPGAGGNPRALGHRRTAKIGIDNDNALSALAGGDDANVKQGRRSASTRQCRREQQRRGSIRNRTSFDDRVVYLAKLLCRRFLGSVISSQLGSEGRARLDWARDGTAPLSVRRLVSRFPEGPTTELRQRSGTPERWATLPCSARPYLDKRDLFPGREHRLWVVGGEAFRAGSEPLRASWGRRNAFHIRPIEAPSRQPGPD